MISCKTFIFLATYCIDQVTWLLKGGRVMQLINPARCAHVEHSPQESYKKLEEVNVCLPICFQLGWYQWKLCLNMVDRPCNLVMVLLHRDLIF